MEHEVDSFSLSPTDDEANLARGLDGDVDEPRLLGGSYKGELCFRLRRKDVHQEIGRQAVRDVRRKIEMILPQLSVLRARRNLPGERVDEYVDGLRERGSALDVMVANKTEHAALGEDRNVFVDGAVDEAEDDT